jgi:hypothetical protein
LPSMTAIATPGICQSARVSFTRESNFALRGDDDSLSNIGDWPLNLPPKARTADGRRVVNEWERDHDGEWGKIVLSILKRESPLRTCEFDVEVS